jgi:hypothetical protein
MKEIFRWQNSPTFLVKFLSIRYLVFLLVFVYKALVDELEMITTQVGTHNRSENGRSAWDVLYDTTP